MMYNLLVFTQAKNSTFKGLVPKGPTCIFGKNEVMV